ncbi:hypothetical protein SVIOM342S_03130 [Streptomyces violaceorubidus]
MARRRTLRGVLDPSRLGGAGDVPLRAGRWNLFLRPDEEGVPDVPFVTDRLAADSFPVQAELNGRRYWLENRWGDFPQLNARSELSDLERGPYRQRSCAGRSTSRCSSSRSRTRSST